MWENSKENTCVRVLFNEVAGLWPATLLKKRLWHKCFHADFAKYSRIPFLQNSSVRMLLMCATLRKNALLQNYFWYFRNQYDRWKSWFEIDSHRRCPVRKHVRKIHGKTPVSEWSEVVLVSVFIKKTLLKKRLWYRCFHVNFAEFLRIPFLQNISGWLLLSWLYWKKSELI